MLLARLLQQLTTRTPAVTVQLSAALRAVFRVRCEIDNQAGALMRRPNGGARATEEVQSILVEQAGSGWCGTGTELDDTVAHRIVDALRRGTIDEPPALGLARAGAAAPLRCGPLQALRCCSARQWGCSTLAAHPPKKC